MEGAVIAAIISGGVALVVAADAAVLNWLLAKQRARSGEDLAKLQAALTASYQQQLAAISLTSNKVLAEHQKLFGILADEQAQDRGRRRDALEALFNATSIANSAAQQIVSGAAVRNHEHRLNETAQAMQKLATFFTEAHKAEDNIRLNKEDLDHVVNVRTALVRLFLSLDLDAEGTEYQSRLSDAHVLFNKAFSIFQDYVRAATSA